MRLFIKRKCSSSASRLPEIKENQSGLGKKKKPPRNRTCHAKLSEDRDLPPDMWREIFARLPVKTLLKFRCVCKNWCSIIENPNFISMHLSNYQNKLNKNHVLVVENIGKYGIQGLTCTIRESGTFREIAQIPQTSQFCNIFVGNCNGLVLLLSSEEFKPNPVKKIVRLWNPSIRKSVILPPSSICKADTTYFLGFSPSSNDYKVVAFSSWQSYAVYSLSSNIWSIKSGNLLPLSVSGASRSRLLYKCPPFSQGATHWLVCGGSVPDKYTHILSFEFDTEDFHTIELPEASDEMIKGLNTLGELLAVFGISHTECCIWSMKKEGGEKLWTLTLPGASSLSYYNFFATYLYPYTKRFYCDDTGIISLLATGNAMASYNISTKQMQSSFLKSTNSRGISFMDTYVESLVLCRGVECQTLTLFP
ncbi:hypothetical protein SOVF_081370 [Spinacia oleracea]|uniref:F-box protein At1g11270 n=1 Tax=Spinacia oleracea TaxID=3562 RepID=A0A9R0JXZ2_SPIOL|nr:F-box protein At1g11270-like [Spinacia oleracea]KNA17292.1 hypothetical protein SOVF_081370 [Spinacia oleracea]